MTYSWPIEPRVDSYACRLDQGAAVLSSLITAVRTRSDSAQAASLLLQIEQHAAEHINHSQETHKDPTGQDSPEHTAGNVTVFASGVDLSDQKLEGRIPSSILGIVYKMLYKMRNHIKKPPASRPPLQQGFPTLATPDRGSAKLSQAAAGGENKRTGSGQGAQQSRSKDPGASGRETVRQCAVEGIGAAVSKGIAGVGGAEADCGRDCCTWRLVCESDGKRAPSSSVNAAKRHSSQTSAGRRSSCYRRNGGL
ncbi:hypothetical protein EYF80_011367 [Liparis tanakae]|uniref:Uncharacterized protein n=1 Tax=Liparis tanakae TaxID=230148 RepID=A0A4Z2IMK5_9TELE|nr:hypothetical protein EYF80_011367 [Liparis tanakae]